MLSWKRTKGSSKLGYLKGETEKMKNGRRILALLIALLMCLVLFAACGDNSTPTPSGGGGSGTPSAPSPSSPAPASPPAEIAPPIAPPSEPDIRFADEIIAISDGFAVTAINPLFPGAAMPPVFWSYNMIYDRLLRTNDNGEQEPYLATEWNTNDFITFDLKLRNDVYFHNGEKFTARDVVWTILSSKEAPGSPSNSIWAFVKEAIAVDDYNVKLILNDINVDFWWHITRTETGILNEKAVTADPERGSWVGTGAYVLTEFVPMSHWYFDRNDNYWGAPPITKRITLLHIPERTTRAMMLLNGEAQIVFNLPAEAVDQFDDNPDFTVYIHMRNTPGPIYFNMSHPICGDWNFRMAVGSAINRGEITTAVGGRFLLPEYETGGLWGLFTEFRNLDIPVLPEDVEAAKAYLAASPYKGETISLTGASPDHVRACEVIQMQLARIGISTEINAVENTAVPGLHAEGKLEILVTGMNFPMSATAIRPILYPNLPTNRTNHNNPTVTEMLDRVAREPNRAEREKIYREIQAIVAEDPPYFNIWWNVVPNVSVNGVGGFTQPGDNSYDLRYMYWQLDD